MKGGTDGSAQETSMLGGGPYRQEEQPLSIGMDNGKVCLLQL